MEPAATHTHPLILFDGECNLCNGAIQFIIRKDRRKLFRFAQLQSVAGGNHLAILRQQAGHTPDSIILRYKGRYYTRSAAALHIARLLGAPWSALYIFMLMPPFIRNAVYNVIARNRYRWFGRRPSCMLPSPAVKDRFL